MTKAEETVVLIELNEVPNEVLDAYSKAHSPFMRKFLAECDRYTTISPDRIQLDPWISWPTFHRGVNDATHRILRLGQDTSQIDQRFPPIWSVLRDGGVEVGVYGSLLSSTERDQAGYSFFVPDVFAPHDRVSPPSLQRFQSFNLNMTRASARNVDDGVSSGGGRAMAGLALSGRLSLGTMGRIARQLVSERLDKRKVSRRRNTQTELHADVFVSLLKEARPKFATFYTNNVAAAMHRFWSASMPSAKLNDTRLSSEWKNAYEGEIFAALYSVERLVKRLTRGDAGLVRIVIASSLGQEEIPAENYERFLTIRDIRAFICRILEDQTAASRIEEIPTMVPDFSIRFTDPREAEQVVEKMRAFTVDGTKAVETLERMHATEIVGPEPRLEHVRHLYESKDGFKHAITFQCSDANILHLSFQIDDYAGAAEAQIGNEHIGFDELGIGFMSHDEGVNCTAQHSAEGSLAVWPANIPEQPQQRPSPISTLDFAPSLLARLDVAKPDYMSGLPTIGLG